MYYVKHKGKEYVQVYKLKAKQCFVLLKCYITSSVVTQTS
jgi:hypothetical protein